MMNRKLVAHFDEPSLEYETGVTKTYTISRSKRAKNADKSICQLCFGKNVYDKQMIRSDCCGFNVHTDCYKRYKKYMSSCVVCYDLIDHAPIRIYINFGRFAQERQLFKTIKDMYCVDSGMEDILLACLPVTYILL